MQTRVEIRGARPLFPQTFGLIRVMRGFPVEAPGPIDNSAHLTWSVSLWIMSFVMLKGKVALWSVRDRMAVEDMTRPRPSEIEGGGGGWCGLVWAGPSVPSVHQAAAERASPFLGKITLSGEVEMFSCMFHA